MRNILDIAAKSSPVSRSLAPGSAPGWAIMRAICQGSNLGLVRPLTGFVMGGAALAHSVDISTMGLQSSATSQMYQRQERRARTPGWPTVVLQNATQAQLGLRRRRIFGGTTFISNTSLKTSL